MVKLPIETVELVLQDWCDECGAEGVDLPFKVEASEVDATMRFCTLQCAARWERDVPDDSTEGVEER